MQVLVEAVGPLSSTAPAPRFRWQDRLSLYPKSQAATPGLELDIDEARKTSLRSNSI